MFVRENHDVLQKSEILNQARTILEKSLIFRKFCNFFGKSAKERGGTEDPRCSAPAEGSQNILTNSSHLTAALVPPLSLGGGTQF